jgi:YVTN family beta-propeller protein
MSFARLLSSRSASLHSFVGRMFRSSLLHALVGAMAMCGGMSVLATMAQAQAVSATVAVGTTPFGVAVNSVTGMIYVINSGSNTVTAINGSNNSTATIAVGSSPYSVALNSATNMIYVVNNSANTVTAINGVDNSTSTINVGRSPEGVAVDAVHNMIYVANLQSSTVTAISGVDNSTSTIPVGSYPGWVGVNAVTNTIYVANTADNTVTVINGANNSTSTIAVGVAPRAVTVNVVTNTIYVANYSSKTVTAINGANNSTSTITVGTQPSALALNDVTNTVYVTNFSSGTVTIINGANNSTSTITVGTYPAALALNELTNTIYVANQGSNTVTVINGANSSTSALNVGLLPGSVAVNPATNIIYVGNNSANTATVINGPPMPSAVAVSCLPNPFSYGAGNSTTCTGTASGGATPTGTLTWTVNAGAPTTSTLSGGVATATELTSNAGGTYTVAAAYGGDTGHLTSSGSTTVTISKASPIPSISCTPNPITYGSQITTCTAAYGSGVTGTVAVTYNGNAWTWPVLSGGSSSQYGFNYQPAGSYAVAVNYSGDANNNAVSGLTTLTISKATGVFSVTSSANPVLPGASVTFTCTATAGGQPLVTGAYMAYWVDGALMENVPTTGGALQWTTSALTVGSHTIACTGGDANYNSAGVNYTEAVTGSTFSSLSSSVTPSSYGQAVKLSSLVSTGGSVPTGTVTFLNGASTIGTSTVASMSATNLIPDSNFQSGSTYWTVVGTEPMVAGVGGMLGGNGFVYTGTGSPAGWMGNTSSVVTVVPGATYTFSGFVDATAVTNGVAQWMIFNPSINTEYAEADMKAGSKGRIFSTFTVPAGVTQVVFITDTSNLTATNGGQVVWGEPQLELASQMGPYVKTGTTATAGYGGVATFTASTLPVGSDSITAVYGGDAADLASTTPSLVQVVNKATPTMSVTCALSVVTYSAGNGALTSCNAVLSAGTGSVTFNGQWTEGIAGGISTISGFEQQAAQVMPLVAVYSGDANYNTVTASTTLTINKATPSITWSTPDSITYGMALSGLQLNATASVAGTFAYLPPAGTVLSAGVQTLSVTFTPTDAVDYSSASGSVTLVVTQATPVATVTSSLNPAAYNAPITFTTVLGEAGNTSTGSVTFKDGATTLGVGTVSQVSTTNLLAWSENALAYGTDYTGSTIDASAVADPLGGSGTVEIDFPAGTNDRWMYAVPLSNTSGKTYIASVWMRAPTPTTIQFNVEEHGGNYTGSNPTVNVGTQWQRYQTTLAIPTSDPGSTAISVGFTNGAGNGATVIDVFGFQLEQSTAIGPYVKTTGTSISGTGALARYTTSSLSVGTHAINGVFGGDSVYPAATSASLQQVVNKVTPVLVLSSSQSPSPLGTSVTFTCTGTNGGQPVVSGTGLGFYVDTIYMGVQLVNGAGAATWSDAALNAGSHDIGCSASDSNYNGVGVDITQVVNKATPTITWATPAPIVYGATLSSTQLNATASAAGSFSYTPGAGTELSAGSQLLTATFTPTDSADYTTATANVTLGQRLPRSLMERPSVQPNSTRLPRLRVRSPTLQGRVLFRGVWDRFQSPRRSCLRIRPTTRPRREV